MGSSTVMAFSYLSVAFLLNFVATKSYITVQRIHNYLYNPARGHLFLLTSSLQQWKFEVSDWLRSLFGYAGRRDNDRGRTPIFRLHRRTSLPSGAPAIPMPIQQTPIHVVVVAGVVLPDASRELDLSRSRVQLSRASRIAQGAPWGLGRVPDFTTLYRFLQCLEEITIDRAVGETVRWLLTTDRKGRR